MAMDGETGQGSLADRVTRLEEEIERDWSQLRAWVADITARLRAAEPDR